jgi:iron complex transport system permease protein
VKQKTDTSLLIKLLYSAGILLFLLSLVLGVSLGAVSLSLKDTIRAILAGPNYSGTADLTVHTIVWSLRLPRVILAALTGASLGIAGAAFQGLFRNSLADPYIIGASSGAALGASLAIISGLTLGFAGLPAVPAAAFVGSILAVAVVYTISGAATSGSPAITLLLAGTALSSMISAVVSFLVVVNDKRLHSVYFWLLGGFSGRTWGDLYGVLPYMIAGAVVLILSSRALDVLAFGEESARTMGLQVPKARLVITAASSLCVAAAVAAGGTIGFIGLVSPHIARLVFGAEHRRVIPGSLLVGAVLLVMADLVARTIAAPIEVPVGIFTAFLGGPFFLYLLRTRGGSLGRGFR